LSRIIILNSIAPSKAKPREPTYSQTLNQHRINWQGGQDPESQTAMVDSFQSLDGEGGRYEEGGV